MQSHGRFPTVRPVIFRTDPKITGNGNPADRRPAQSWLLCRSLFDFMAEAIWTARVLRVSCSTTCFRTMSSNARLASGIEYSRTSSRGIWSSASSTLAQMSAATV